MFYGNKPALVPSQNGFVYVIESPSAEDLLDGRTEGRALVEALRIAGISTWYSHVSNRATLYSALGDRLAEAARLRQVAGISGPQGISLSDLLGTLGTTTPQAR